MFIKMSTIHQVIVMCEDLPEDVFWEWFVENQPFRGKMNAMKKITDAFPESSFPIRQPFPPYGLQKYCTHAAKLMNKWKQEGKIMTEKSGNTYIYRTKYDSE